MVHLPPLHLMNLTKQVQNDEYVLYMSPECLHDLKWPNIPLPTNVYWQSR